MRILKLFLLTLFYAAMLHPCFGQYVASPASPTYVQSGYGTWGAILKVRCTISGSLANFEIRKIDGSAFSSSGTVYIDENSSGSWLELGYKNISAGATYATVSVSLSQIDDNDFPVDFRAYYAASIGGYAVVGDIEIDYTPPPSVSNVTPTSATLGCEEVFTIYGSNLTSSTAFFIGECAGLVDLGGSSTYRQFRCTPSYTTGYKSGQVKDAPGGNVLYNFNLNVTFPTPSGLSATTQGQNSIYLSWQNVSKADNYRLYRATSCNGSYQQIYWAGSNYYYDSGSQLDAGTTYYYKVKACENQSSNSCSEYSTCKSATTTSYNKPISFSPSNTQTGIAYQSPTSFSWNNNNSTASYSSVLYTLKRYDNYVSSNSPGAATQVLYNNHNLGSSNSNNSFTHNSDLEPDTWYRYWVELNFSDGTQRADGAYFKTAPYTDPDGNYLPSHAQTITLDSYRSATSTNQDDNDWFKVYIPQTGRLGIAVETVNAFDVQFRVFNSGITSSADPNGTTSYTVPSYDPVNNENPANDNGWGINEFWSNIDVNPGWYYIKVAMQTTPTTNKNYRIYADYLETPSISSPTNNQTGVDVSPTVSWSGNNGVDWRLQVKNNTNWGTEPNWNTMAFNNNVSNASSQLVSPALAENTSYYARVRSAKPMQLEPSTHSVISPFSSVISFTTWSLNIDLLVQNGATASPSSITQGGTTTINCTLENQGADAAGAFELHSYLSTDMLYDDLDDIQLASQTVNAMAAGTIETQNYTVSIPAGTTAGNYYLLVFADALDAVTEADEDNNLVAIPITVIENSLATFDIIIQPNWNIISSYITPHAPDMDDVWPAISNNIDIVKDMTDTYVPPFAINNIGDWVIEDGYKVKSNATVPITLTISGTKIDPQARPIPLNYGWNMIAYLKDAPSPVDAEFAGVVNSIDLVKNAGGNIYSPDFSINQIGNMEPGQGYKVKTNAATTLTYSDNANFGKQATTSTPVLAPLHFTEPIRKTEHNATIIIPQEGAGEKLHIGDEIAVYNTSQQLCGIGVYPGQSFALSIWSDDPATNVLEGMAENETYRLRYWNSEAGEEEMLQPIFQSGDQQYHKDDIEVVGDFEKITTSVSNVFESLSWTIQPNPTKGIITIDLNLDRKYEDLRIELIDALGRTVALVAHDDYPQGSQQVTYDGRQLPAGIYFLRLSNKDQKQARRILKL